MAKLVAALGHRRGRDMDTARPFNWLKHLALPVGLAMMEACWLYPWALLLGMRVDTSAVASLLSAPLIFALLIIGRSATKVALGRRWPLSRVRIALMALGGVAVLTVLRIDQYGHVGLLDPSWLFALGSAFSSVLTHLSAPVLAAALCLFLWWRGIAHGRDDVDFDDLWGAFRLGLVALVCFLLLAAGTDPVSRGILQSRVAVFVIGFFFAGLTSLSLAELEDIRSHRRTPSDRPLVFNRQWLMVMLTVVAALLLLTLLLAQLVSFDLIATVSAPLLDLLGNAAWLLLWAIAIPIGYLLEVVIFLVRLILHPGAPPPPIEPPDMSFLEQMQREGGPRGLSPELAFAAKWAIIGAVGFVVVVLLARAIFRWHGGEQDEGVSEERDSVWAWDYLWAAILALLRNLWERWVSRNEREPASATAVTIPMVAGSPVVLTVRQIYRQLLRLGAFAGVPRAIYSTPYEHLPRLQSSIRPAADIAAITESYVRARYGLDVPLDAEIEDLQTRWDRVQAFAESIDSEARTQNMDKQTEVAPPHPHRTDRRGGDRGR